jgi:hypothetical protein
VQRRATANQDQKRTQDDAPPRSGGACEIPLDHPDLTRGWWAVERDERIVNRWTDGEAVLPLPAMSGTVMLELHLAGSMIYAVDAAPEDRTERRAAA